MVVIAVITFAMMAAVEIIVRVAFPQKLTTLYRSGETLGLPDPVLGHVNNPGVIANVSGPEFSVDYQISPQGFRGPTIYGPTPAPGVTRILAVGDSFTFGASSDHEDIWIARTEATLKAAGHRVEIINAGVEGYDTASSVLSLERLYDQYRPDIVVYGFVLNDLFTNKPIEMTQSGERVSPEGLSLVGFKQRKRGRLQSVRLLRSLLMRDDAAYRRMYMMTARKEYYLNPPSPRVRAQIDVTKDLLSRAAGFCAENGARFFVLSMPQLYQVLAEANDDGAAGGGIDPDYVDEELGAFAGQKGFAWVPTLDALAADYRAKGEELYFRLDGHLTPAGQAIVADVAAASLAQEIAATKADR